MIKYIVTHPGQAHRDDILAVAIALAYYGCAPVHRREPTIEELDDPKVVILDCGGHYNPELRNFDHHQLTKDSEPECALSLLTRNLTFGGTFEEALQLQPWWQHTVLLDSKGPKVAAEALGMEKLPDELSSPVEETLLAIFGSRSVFGKWGYGDTPNGEAPRWDPILEILRILGSRLIENAQMYAHCREHISGATKVIEVDKVKCFLILEVLSPEMAKALQQYRNLEHPDIAISIAFSDREGESWVLYRYDDHPAVDFSRLIGNDQVAFAHTGGFIAKLVSDVSEEEAIKLVKAALV